MDVRDKVVLVTGGSRGLGKRLVEHLCGAGASVAFCARRYVDLAPIEAGVTQNGGRAMAMACDVRLEDEVVRLVHRVVQRFGRIDAVVNCAAVPGPRVPISRYPLDPWRDVLDTNLNGTYLVCREAIGTLARSGGSIVNVSDPIAQAGDAERGAYLVSKCAIEGLTRMLAEELRPSGVRVNVLDPGPNYQERQEPPDLRDQARMQIVQFLISDVSRTLTGTRIDATEPGVVERLSGGGAT